MPSPFSGREKLPPLVVLEEREWMTENVSAVRNGTHQIESVKSQLCPSKFPIPINWCPPEKIQVDFLGGGANFGAKGRINVEHAMARVTGVPRS